jgi:uncharacterized membrane protein YoaK (UPF0700 family)
MLSAQAHSFRHKSRLAISLSWVAGFTNVIMFITAGQFISHQTGNITHFGSAIGGLFLSEPRAASDALYFAFLPTTFLLGAIASAFMTETARRARKSSIYVLPVTIEAILLSILLATLLLNPHPASTWRSLYLTTGLAAFAMGLQNATITKISGAVVRTTHVTGVITDLGLESVHLFLWYRDKLASDKPNRLTRTHPSALRALLLFSILSSFLFGATLGTLSLAALGPYALLAPILFLLTIARLSKIKLSRSSPPITTTE